jgi:hypothetical protein
MELDILLVVCFSPLWFFQGRFVQFSSEFFLFLEIVFSGLCGRTLVVHTQIAETFALLCET